MNEWNEPSWRTDLAQMPTQDQHKSTKTMNLEMSWWCQNQPILSFLPICDPIMLQTTIVDSSHYRQNRRTQQDEKVPEGTPPLTSRAVLQAHWE